ncbi:transcription initiation factor IIB [Halegenticoccus tardaugens]|uniref:transcription initiation factor IIB n=1 Tax=Halegenticoccus tardaugens TaxID=2071624 RepID=UPI00100A2F05|nr:transcription initiation factor IIB 3 [Halegenticoccus tardaugens]
MSRSFTQYQEQKTKRSTPRGTDDREKIDQEYRNSLVRTKDGELIDPETGEIIEERTIDYGPEWRAFDFREHEERSRTGAPLTERMHDRGLTTEIGWQNRDANGNSLSAEKRRQMHRLRTWQERIRTQNSGERNLQFALSEIDRMASALGVPDSVREVASVIYRRALKRDLIRGRSIEAVATGALYAAIRQEGIPHSLGEVSNVSRVERTEIGRAYRNVSNELGLGLPPTDPREFLPRYCSELELDDAVERRAHSILTRVMDEGRHSGKAPAGVAAASVYLAGLLYNSKRTQQEVADAANVTVVTIRHRYHEQLEVIAE